EDGVLNASYNCIDRHLPKRANQTAIIWEGDDPSQSRHITYRELHDEVCKLANILRNRNVAKGDRVTIYLPMIPELAFATLACAPARVSAQSIRWCSAASRRSRSPAASRTASPT